MRTYQVINGFVIVIISMLVGWYIPRFVSGECTCHDRQPSGATSALPPGAPR